MGSYYQWFVFVFSFGSVISTIYHKFEDFDDDREEILATTDDIIYTLHFIMLIFMKGDIYDYERRSIIMMFIHLISG